MIQSKILGAAAGIQYQGNNDLSETNSPSTLTNGLIVGRFKRGMTGAPFTVTNNNYQALLGFDPTNPDYMAVQDAFALGISELQVMRVGKVLTTGGSDGGGGSDVINPFVRIIFKPEYTGYYPSVIAQKSEGYDYFLVNGVDIKDSIGDSIADNSGVIIMASSDGSIAYTTYASPVKVELKFSDAIDRSLYIKLLEGVATIGSDRTMSFVI